jgi:hypothetical protein
MNIEVVQIVGFRNVTAFDAISLCNGNAGFSFL